MGRVVAFVVTCALIVFGLMFSVILLAIIATAGFLAFCYLWWKTRAVRRQMRKQFREQAAGGAAGGEFTGEVFKGEVFKGDVIEGEVIRRVVIKDAIER